MGHIQPRGHGGVFHFCCCSHTLTRPDLWQLLYFTVQHRRAGAQRRDRSRDCRQANAAYWLAQLAGLYHLGPPAQGWLHPPRCGPSCINNHVLWRSTTDSTPFPSNASRQPCINNQEMPTGQSDEAALPWGSLLPGDSVSVICGNHTWIHILVCQSHSGTSGN